MNRIVQQLSKKPRSCPASSGKSVCCADIRTRPCPVPRAKIFLFYRNTNQSYIHRRPVPLEGRFAIVTSAGRDAVDADGASDEGIGRGRRSRVVLTPQWLASSRRRQLRR